MCLVGAESATLRSLIFKDLTEFFVFRLVLSAIPHYIFSFCSARGALRLWEPRIYYTSCIKEWRALPFHLSFLVTSRLSVRVAHLLLLIEFWAQKCGIITVPGAWLTGNLDAATGSTPPGLAESTGMDFQSCKAFTRQPLSKT